MVKVDMHITKRMYKIAGCQAADVGHHHGQEGVGGDIERDTEEHICRTLIELATQFPIGHIKLEQAMAGCQCHVSDIANIPGGDDHPAAVGIGADGLHHLADLIDGLAIGSGPTAPLMAIHRAQVPVFIRPLIPDPDAMVLQVLHICISFEEPKQFVDNGFDVEFFGGQHGESLLQIHPHLVPECADRSGTGPIVLLNAVIEYMSEEILIGLQVGWI